MVRTVPLNDIIRDIAKDDPEYRVALLQEALDCILSAELADGQVLLRTYVNATIGFPELGERTGKSPKSLMRMLSPQGNPTAANLLAILKSLQEAEGVVFVAVPQDQAPDQAA